MGIRNERYMANAAQSTIASMIDMKNMHHLFKGYNNLYLCFMILLTTAATTVHMNMKWEVLNPVPELYCHIMKANSPPRVVLVVTDYSCLLCNQNSSLPGVRPHIDFCMLT